jgi:hypothetical protein
MKPNASPFLNHSFFGLTALIHAPLGTIPGHKLLFKISIKQVYQGALEMRFILRTIAAAAISLIVKEALTRESQTSVSKASSRTSEKVN